MSSRYYDPEVGRFINADGIVGDGLEINGYNMFSYCGNNPVVRVDDGGRFWDTIFDVVSLVVSIVDVIQHPDDPMAWLSLAGDAIDLVPFMTGVGETARAIKTTDNIVDTVKKADRVADAVDNAHDTVKELHRPYIRKSVRQAVEDAAPRVSDGRFFDNNIKKPLMENMI